MIDFPEFDDVGSFPLPTRINAELFDRFYWTTYKAIANKRDPFSNRGIRNYFVDPLLNSFKLKLNAGVGIINYPQHMNMYTQFLKPIADYETEPNLIDPDKAYIPEAIVLEEFAKKHYEETGKSLKIKVCVTGPIDLYIKRHNFTIYKDLALNFARSINSFFKNSRYSSKYLTTSIVSIDEPSFGYVDLVNVNNDDLIEIYDKSLEGVKSKYITTQIHIHTLIRADIPLRTENIEVLTCEYASDKKNKISRNLLEKYDKFIRVGITRTNIDNIIAEALDKGETWENLKTYDGLVSLIDSKEQIQKNLLEAIDMYGERLRFIGPDCGLGGWQDPQIAFELLKRTNDTIQSVNASL